MAVLLAVVFFSYRRSAARSGPGATPAPVAEVTAPGKSDVSVIREAIQKRDETGPSPAATAKLLTDKDVLVLAEFTNTTGDPVFDGTLREALAVQLEQSPFLKVMSDEQVRHNLQLMGRSLEERVTNAIAREICQRESQKAMIGGSIAALGRTYAIALQATNCESGEPLAREQVQAEDKEHVLQAVAKAATGMRGKLGESLASIQPQGRYAYDRVTTNSLEALQAFAMGTEQFRLGSALASVPFFKRATELDPNFASAWLYLTTAAGISGVFDPSATGGLRKAYDLRERVSERERQLITIFYFQNQTQEWNKAIEANRLMARTYPRSPMPHNMLGLIYRNSGQLEDALREAQAAYNLEPVNTGFVANLMRDYIRMNRFADAQAVGEKAISQGLVAADLHGLMLNAAYLLNDAAVD
jgi:tetratricopeptide (TPR) repeat protein